jgi:cell division protein FtsQ
VLTRLAVIQADDPAGITLRLRDQRIVRWGSADRSADKARILVTLLRRPGTLFDVSNPDLVYTR